ncbi:T9SS type A sorting domain-containing protein [bacterium]|nr:T9SS type A sorting domain-containing protein [bacterium]
MQKKPFVVSLGLLLIIASFNLVYAQQKTIVFVSRPGYLDPFTGEHSDKLFIDDLIDLGYNVIPFYNTALELASEATLDTLNNADLVIVGRSTSSNDFGPPHKEAWNDVTAPMLMLHLWCARSQRMNWFETESCVHYNDIGALYAHIIEPDDPVFEGKYVLNELVLWAEGAYDVLDILDAGNGTALVIADDFTIQFARFEAGFEFYPGSVDMPAGPRTYIGNGNDDPTDSEGTHIFNYYNFSEAAKQVYFNEVALLTGAGISAVDEAHFPDDFALNQNYPNPFNPSTAISYTIPKTAQVCLAVYDIRGREVATLVNEIQGEGFYRVRFNGQGFPGGIYVCKLSMDSKTSTRKMMMMK